jgi:hypothetical protein
LLQRHVGGGADDYANAGYQRGTGEGERLRERHTRFPVSSHVTGGKFRQSEIEHFFGAFGAPLMFAGLRLR